MLDLKRFTPGKELPAGLLWVAEQIPGLVASADLTEQLARGYFPSYNIPYFPQVLLNCDGWGSASGAKELMRRVHEVPKSRKRQDVQCSAVTCFKRKCTFQLTR